MRSPRVFFDAVPRGHWPSHRQSPALHEYPRCWIIMQHEEPAQCRWLQSLLQEAR